MNLPHIDAWIHGNHDTMPSAPEPKTHRTADGRDRIEQERREQIRRDIETEEHGNGTGSDTEHGTE